MDNSRNILVSTVSYLTKAIQEGWGQVLAQEKALQAAKRKQQEAAAANPDAFQQSPMLCSTFTSFLVDKQFY